MANQGGEVSFMRGIFVGTDMRIDISISVRPVTTMFDKQVLTGELTQIRLIK